MTWISVEERLPEYDKSVLAKMTYGQPSYLVVALKAVTSKGAAWEEYKRSESTDELSHVGCVTHWQPLPEPPKEEK